MNEPFKVIGQMVWEVPDGQLALNEINKRLINNSSEQFIFRNCEENKLVKSIRGNLRNPNYWHKDRTNSHMLVWSNREATEIRLDHTVYTFAPYDVILLDDRVCHHRIPEIVSDDRLFWRLLYIDGNISWS